MRAVRTILALLISNTLALHLIHYTWGRERSNKPRPLSIHRPRINFRIVSRLIRLPTSGVLGRERGFELRLYFERLLGLAASASN